MASGEKVCVGDLYGAPIYTTGQWADFVTALLSMKPGDKVPGIVAARMSDADLAAMGCRMVPVIGTVDAKPAGSVPGDAGTTRHGILP